MAKFFVGTAGNKAENSNQIAFFVFIDIIQILGGIYLAFIQTYV